MVDNVENIGGGGVVSCLKVDIFSGCSIFKVYNIAFMYRNLVRDEGTPFFWPCASWLRL